MQVQSSQSRLEVNALNMFQSNFRPLSSTPLNAMGRMMQSTLIIPLILAINITCSKLIEKAAKFLKTCKLNLFLILFHWIYVLAYIIVSYYNFFHKICGRNNLPAGVVSKKESGAPSTALNILLWRLRLHLTRTLYKYIPRNVFRNTPAASNPANKYILWSGCILKMTLVSMVSLRRLSVSPCDL